MDSKQKILIVGDVNGKFSAFFARIENVNKKTGPFDLVLCVGSFFGPCPELTVLEEFKAGRKSVAIPVYILGPVDEASAKNFSTLTEGDICQNLSYLGKRGIFSTSSGLKIAYVSGLEVEGSSASGKVPDWKFTKEDAVAVRDSCFASKSNMGDYRGVDLLLTSQWPAHVKEDVRNGSKAVAWLADAVKPRYHVCGLNGEYYEPPPYRSKTDKNTQMELATRFIGLGEFANPEKKKNIYALNVTPVEKMRIIELIQKTTDETPSPYTELNLSEDGNATKEDRGNQYFYDMNNSYDDNRGQKRRSQGNRGISGNQNDQKRQRPTFDQEKCWFCLSSGSIEKHLIIAVGEHFYLALAKGPVNETHILILSITHIQNASLLSPEQWAELNKFKLALTQFFKDREETIFLYERNYKTGHLQINAIGVDNNVAWKIKHVLEDKSEEHGIKLETMPKPASPSELPQKTPYFVAELPDETIMFTKQMKNFPLHFGREIICADNLLNCEEKIDWRQCNLDRDEEDTMAKRFRESYKPYDFTL
ncbi:CWF19-like protein 1 homolog [Culex pipiens pallens]|uniref:CWF19-like protein 1 homolog n=1 Tax=Culex pipiens pallens TaxID=42434 RepID=UPI001954709D|nr:CWF19-like protein 1 homolog [Culex pipiens pallens]